MVQKSAPLSWAAALVVVTTLAVYAVTDNDVVADVCYLGILVAASLGAWLGVLRAPPGRRRVPRLIAIGVSCSALGDVVWTMLDRIGANTDVSLADPAWIVSYGFLCAALWVVLGRTRADTDGRVDVDFLIDAATIVVVSVLLFWSFIVPTVVDDQSQGVWMRLVGASYPVGDAVLLALVVRVLISRGARADIDPAFAVGVVLWLAADIAYLTVPQSDSAVLAMDSAWMIAPVLLARAAWQSGRADTPAVDPAALGGVTQLVLAVGPLLVPPALELAADMTGGPDRLGRLLFGTVVLVGLAFARARRLFRSVERARQELVEARDAALEASRAKSMFLANVSHEIRTPLTTVLASGEMLEDTPLDDLQRNLLGRVNRSGELLKRLVEGILDFSRIEAGQLRLASTPFDLHELVADTEDLYGPRAAEVGLRFECLLDPCVPRHVVGDPGRLFQVLTNLLENALKFTHEGEVVLVVCNATTGPGDAPEVEFLVTDTGIGIHEEDQAAVFDSFRQVDGSTTRRYGGTGLGLAICKELAGLMGGEITVQSRYGAGSTFSLRLPVACAHPDRATPDPGRGSRVPAPVPAPQLISSPDQERHGQ